MKDLMEMLKKLTDYLEKCEGKLKSGCLSIRQKDRIEGEINATKYAISYNTWEKKNIILIIEESY